MRRGYYFPPNWGYLFAFGDGRARLPKTRLAKLVDRLLYGGGAQIVPRVYWYGLYHWTIGWRWDHYEKPLGGLAIDVGPLAFRLWR